jgi:adenylate kinase family enzyme
MQKGTLIFFCGKMGTGKTTKSREIALERNAVLLSEDEWLASVYPNTITSLKDYVKYSKQLKPPIKKLVQSILNTATDVVMDFPANTISQREWFRSIFSGVDAPHQLIYIDISNEGCLERIDRRRIEQPEREATDTAEMFHEVAKYFVEPASEEGFNAITISSYA